MARYGAKDESDAIYNARLRVWIGYTRRFRMLL